MLSIWKRVVLWADDRGEHEALSHDCSVKADTVNTRRMDTKVELSCEPKVAGGHELSEWREARRAWVRLESRVTAPRHPIPYSCTVEQRTSGRLHLQVLL